MPSLGLVCNSYNEANALPGWLETHLPFFDDVRVYHAGPHGELSNDGTMEILEKWHVPYLVGSIDDGFGPTRTRAIHSSPCDYVMLLDCDERFFPVVHRLTCHGENTSQQEIDEILRGYDFRDVKNSPPDWDNLGRLGANLRVDVKDPYDQGARLREILASNPDAVTTIRRHWHGFGFSRPTQNWQVIPDWQLRVVRNDPSIYYEGAMHEKLCGVVRTHGAEFERGPYFDHFHFHFKRMEMEQRAHDINTYDRVHRGDVPLSWERFKSGDR